MKHKSTRTATSLELAVVALLMVMGLLAPVIGPAIDHHFADRSPAHAHIFVASPTNDHIHTPVQTHGDHDHALGPNSDTISVLSTSVSPASHSPLALDGPTIESIVPWYGNYLSALYIGVLPITDGQAITPLDRPPRLG